MVADVGLVFERAIITLISFEFDHLHTLGPTKLLKRTIPASLWSVVVADVMGIKFSNGTLYLNAQNTYR